MDWSKAKTILLIALVIVNMLLGSIYLLEKNEEKSHEFSEDELINKLSQKDIKLNVDIPNGKYELKGLVVEYEFYDANDINDRFFDEKGAIKYINNDLFEVSRQRETVTVINGKLLIYEEEKTETEPEEKVNVAMKGLSDPLEKANEIAMQFMTDRGFSTDDMKLTFSNLTEDGYYLAYSNIYDGNYIESSFTTFEIKDDKVFRMERTWLDIKEIQDVGLNTIPAKKALLELLMKEEVYGKEITDISICYYFDPEKQDYFSKYNEIIEGRTVPAWRIQFSDGYKIILDFE